jgi:AcrR family transcriptional regulator
MAARKRRADAPPEPQLPSGRHGVPRAEVVANQRERIMRAVTATVGAYGFEGSSVERITRRAGVSRRTFYEQFEGREDSYLQTYDLLADCLLEKVKEAWAEPVEGPARLRRCLEILLDSVAEDPERARVFIVDSMAVGPAALEHRDRHTRVFAAMLEQGVIEHTGAPPPPLAIDGLVAAIHDVVYKRVAQGAAQELPELLEDLLSFCMMVFRYSPVVARS